MSDTYRVHVTVSAPNKPTKTYQTEPMPLVDAERCVNQNIRDHMEIGYKHVPSSLGSMVAYTSPSGTIYVMFQIVGEE